MTAPEETTVRWWGRWPDLSGNDRPSLWHQVEIPEGETPWTWDGMHWLPITVWLPHPPVRRRRR